MENNSASDLRHYTESDEISEYLQINMLISVKYYK